MSLARPPRQRSCAAARAGPAESFGFPVPPMLPLRLVWHHTNRPRGPFLFGPGQITDICDQYHFWSLHPGGASFLFADVLVHFLPYGAADLLPLRGTRSGGETASLP